MAQVIIQRPGVEVIPGLKLRCPCIGHTDSVILVTWSPAGDRLASVSRDKTVRVWDPETGNCRSTVPVKDGASNVDWLSKGEFLAYLDDPSWFLKEGREVGGAGASYINNIYIDKAYRTITY